MGLAKEDRQLWRAVLRTVRPFPFTSSKTKLLVGVSGGTDSLALLHLLWRQLGAARLVVAHLNHGMRPEAAAEAQFVEETAVSWQIPYVGQTVDVAQMASQEKLSVEAAGRRARYAFFAEQAVALGATAVTTAHHADDQAETVLLHLLRGSGSAGLRGMLPVSALPGAANLLLLRPFLHISRTDIEAYCARHGLAPRHDSSNAETEFARNRVRHELLPLLHTYNPQIATRLQQLATITADEYAVLAAQFEAVFPTVVAGQGVDWLIIRRDAFAQLPVALQRLALRRAVGTLRPFHTEISFTTIEQARMLILAKASGKQATLPGQLIMRTEAAEVIFGDAGAAHAASAPQMATDLAQRLPIPGRIFLDGAWQIAAVLRPEITLPRVQQNKDRWQAFVDVGEDELLWVRPFLPNERFQPLGLGGHTQLIQDLLSDRKVRQGKRPLWPLVATSAHPAWIVGQHVDERVRVTTNSSRIVQLICKSPIDD